MEDIFSLYSTSLRVVGTIDKKSERAKRAKRRNKGKEPPRKGKVTAIRARRINRRMAMALGYVV